MCAHKRNLLKLFKYALEGQVTNGEVADKEHVTPGLTWWSAG